MQQDIARSVGVEETSPEVDASGVDRSQIRQFLQLSLAERLAWLDDHSASLVELRRLNPQLGQQ